MPLRATTTSIPVPARLPWLSNRELGHRSMPNVGCRQAQSDIDYDIMTRNRCAFMHRSLLDIQGDDILKNIEIKK